MSKAHKNGQIAFWVFIFLFVFDYHFIDNNWAEATGYTLLEVASYQLIFYVNLLVLIPRLWKGKQVQYVLSCLFMVGLYIAFMKSTGLENVLYDYGGWRNVFSMLLNTLLFGLMSTMFWYFEQWQLERNRQLVLRAEKLEAELQFLRLQIGPHFIFNTLNNIYALALQKHDNTAPMVARLSTLLRYVLYDAGRGQVLLNKELDTLRGLIDLHLLRKPSSTNVDLYIEGKVSGWQISPMMLITIAENCFKHGNIENDADAFIKMACEVGEDGSFVFHTQNSHRPGVSVSEASGIGLENARRQLAIDYPDAHQLTVTEEGDIFIVQLTIAQLRRA